VSFFLPRKNIDTKTAALNKIIKLAEKKKIKKINGLFMLYA
jgi:hypothetical protein